MATTTDESAAKARATDARPPSRDEAARIKAYLDLWERHVTLSAVDGPILPRFRPPA